MTEEGVAIDDLDGMLSELAIDGIEPIWSKNYTEYSTRFAYLNTGKIAGLIFELIERKKPEAEKK